MSNFRKLAVLAGKIPGPQQAHYAAITAGLQPALDLTEPVASHLDQQGATWRAALARKGKWLGERSQESAAKQYGHAGYRWTSDLLPDIGGDLGPLAGLGVDLAAGIAGNKGDVQKATDDYRKHIGKYEESDVGKSPSRPMTPWQAGIGSNMLLDDAQIAAHTFNRKEHPWHYWLNPFVKTGPGQELGKRLGRRSTAIFADPDARFRWSQLIPLVGDARAVTDWHSKDRRARVRAGIEDYKRDHSEKKEDAEEKKANFRKLAAPCWSAVWASLPPAARRRLVDGAKK